MQIVTSTQIEEPKIEVSPPLWVRAIFWSISVAVLAGLTQLPIANAILKNSMVGIYGLAMLGIFRKQLNGNYLTTLQANRQGLYFQTGDMNEYIHVPWKNIGLIEKAIFPLNRRGLRMEITGDLIEPVKHSKDIGNVQTRNGRTYIYTLPQMRNRDWLIQQFESFRREIGE